MLNSAVTMGQLQQKLDLIANNMANAGTNGYKTRGAEFSSLLYQQINNQQHADEEIGRLTPNGIRIGSGARLGATNLNMTEGAILTTGRDLDVALLEKNQFFQVLVTENGVQQTQYTRDGSFSLQPVNNGESLMLVTKAGYPVQGENGPILLDPSTEKVSITSDGIVQGKTNGVIFEAGQLQVVQATRPRLLEAKGDNLLGLPENVNVNVGDILQVVANNTARLKTGALEASNVDIAKEMTEMIMVQRAYQFNGRSISMGDQMSGLINQLR
ncbi:flagellar hook-basal body protein [Bacillaceae bacterium S4-13-56]